MYIVIKFDIHWWHRFDIFCYKMVVIGAPYTFIYVDGEIWLLLFRVGSPANTRVSLIMVVGDVL